MHDYIIQIYFFYFYKIFFLIVPCQRFRYDRSGILYKNIYLVQRYNVYLAPELNVYFKVDRVHAAMNFTKTR